MGHFSEFVVCSQSLIELSGNIPNRFTERFEIKETSVKQMRWSDIPQSLEHRRANVGNLFFEVLYQSLYSLALEIRLRTAEITRDDREIRGASHTPRCRSPRYRPAVE